MKEKTVKNYSEKVGRLWLWSGFLLPPLAWAVQLQTVYLLSERGCARGDFMPIHLTSVFALLAAVAGGVISWSGWVRAGRGWRSDDGGAISRSRFMSILGMMTGALFALVIIAQWLPTLLGVPCDK